MRHPFPPAWTSEALAGPHRKRGRGASSPGPPPSRCIKEGLSRVRRRWHHGALAVPAAAAAPGRAARARPAPPTCYSRMLALSREISADFQSLRAMELLEPCVMYLPRLYLDIHNYCVLVKLRDFVSSPQCWNVAQVDALKEKVKKLYSIMNSFCRRDLVFLSDDCSALEYPAATMVLPDRQT
ncbi:cytokine-like protein 1 [Tupaia chinensis]|uniref:Cytokine-like protein 1 n=1 Tax=Tupaia chinensis TaxID=246437 RepID=L8YFM4_TUPCH|nr:cytokine-like protein 1 [Tupaia chinensis]ELV13226.1 Cytokine-like protein 1 [Tupaia chinensis]